MRADGKRSGEDENQPGDDQYEPECIKRTSDMIGRLRGLARNSAGLTRDFSLRNMNAGTVSASGSP